MIDRPTLTSRKESRQSWDPPKPQERQYILTTKTKQRRRNRRLSEEIEIQWEAKLADRFDQDKNSEHCNRFLAQICKTDER